MINTSTLIFAIGFIFSINAMAQDRLQAARTYESGESITAPLLGLIFKVPMNWQGYYPNDSEIFMMSNDTAVDIRCMYFVNQSNLKKLATNWKKGFPLASGLSIELDGGIVKENDIISANVKLTERNDVQGQVMAKCGEFGNCVTAMVYGQTSEFKKYISQLSPLISDIKFVKPIPRSRLDEFDWQKELTGKYLFAYEREQSSKKKSQIWLDLDGTFKSKISQTDMFKGTAGEYKGKKKGSYLIYNKKNEQPAKLVLLFSKLPDLILPLEKRDNQFFVNGQVFYFSAY